MAGKTQIPLPDGSTVEVPAWASESTLLAMARQAQRTNVLSNEMLKGVKELRDVDDEVIKTVTNIVEGVGSNADSTKANQKTFLDKTVGTAKMINSTATFFGDAEKPMTSMVGAVEHLAGKLKGPGGRDGFKKLTGKLGWVGGMMKKFGGALNVGADVALAWAGWNAAKFEQFAEVQKKMIDSGAIFYSSAKEFDTLYSDSFKAGVTYNAFSDTITNFGGAMTALGGDVSRGAKEFQGMFKTLSENTDELGDLGFQNTELMNQYAAFLETQRLVGNIDLSIANVGQKLEKGFTDLVVESTALASLTSLNRGDALQRQMAAISDTFAAAGLQNLKDNGMGDQALAAESVIRQLSLIKDQGPGSAIMEELAAAMNKNIYEFSDNIGNFDVRKDLSAEARAAFDKTMPGFIDRINTMVRTGEMNQGEAQQFLIKEFSNMDLTKIATSGAASDSMMGSIAALQSSGVLIKKNFAQYINKSGEEINALIDETKEKLKASGSTVRAMNDASKMFLTAQQAITLPLNNLTNITQDIAGWFEENSGMIKEQSTKFFNPTIDDEGNSSNSTTTSDSKQDNDNNIKPMDFRNNVKSSANSNIPALSMPKPDMSLQDQLKILNSRLTERENNSTMDFSMSPREAAMKASRDEKELKLIEAQIEFLKKQIKAEEDEKMNRLREQKMHLAR